MYFLKLYHFMCAFSLNTPVALREGTHSCDQPYGNSPIMESLWAWIWNTGASLPWLKHQTVFPSVAAWGGGYQLMNISILSEQICEVQ